MRTMYEPRPPLHFSLRFGPERLLTLIAIIKAVTPLMPGTVTVCIDISLIICQSATDGDTTAWRGQPSRLAAIASRKR